MSFKLRDYQTELSKQGSEILNKYKIVYFACQVRVGKTLIALNTANLYGAKNVLFITKKRAIPSIENDYELLNPNYTLTVINNESLHKIDHSSYDLLISDEHHRNGAFPKPNQVTKLIKQNYSHLPMIFLSGTPHPESYSQIYHQFWLSDYSPFNETNFYKWSKTYVNVKDRHLGYAVVKDYTDANYSLIKPIIDKYMITFTQSQAGFETEVKENVITVKMNDLTYNVANRLKKDLFLTSKDGKEVTADTGVKLMQKLHQIYSGTVLFEDGSYRVLDYTKAYYIKQRFANNKIALFYKFKAEYECLKQVFKDKLTSDLNEFNTTDKNIALQIVSGSEGISLKEADYLIYYNIDFSSKNYWQSRERLATIERPNNNVFWIFSENGIEHKIYEKVINKKNYTLNVFKKDYDLPTGINKRMD